MHRPNEYYLEYVPDDVVKDAIAYLTTEHFDKSAPIESSTETPAPQGIKRSSYLSHNRSLQLFTDLFTTWVSGIAATSQ